MLRDINITKITAHNRWKELVAPKNACNGIIFDQNMPLKRRHEKYRELGIAL